MRAATWGSTGWHRLAALLVKMGECKTADETYRALLNGQKSEDNESAIFYIQLGHVKDQQGDYENAIKLYQKARQITEKSLPVKCVNSYFCIGIAYMAMGDYRKALLFYQKILKIPKEFIPPNSPFFDAILQMQTSDTYKSLNKSTIISSYRKRSHSSYDNEDDELVQFDTIVKKPKQKAITTPKPLKDESSFITPIPERLCSRELNFSDDDSKEEEANNKHLLSLLKRTLASNDKIAEELNQIRVSQSSVEQILKSILESQKKMQRALAAENVRASLG
ncbi:unnamed protein product [Didymodactylos carnosus]|uniref:Uncharacterized protein n=1 Tax=Didymodactylos carnosus TaxID=1234261 RepID=A0A815YIV1_9BILA|nr:unnamed protein product [Didymodactylos carnosus]CAF4434693.1 unnamed protein product [Didymodactylos carnosus]